MKHALKKYLAIVAKFRKYIHPDDPWNEIKMGNTFKSKKRNKN